MIGWASNEISCFVPDGTEPANKMKFFAVSVAQTSALNKNFVVEIYYNTRLVISFGADNLTMQQLLLS